MQYEFTGAWMIPGITAAVETFENQFWFDRYENQIWTGVVVSGASRDTGNTGATDVLRPGLLLGKVSNTNKVKPWNPAASDGSEQIFGILGPASKMTRLGADQDRWLGFIMVGGWVKAHRLLIPGETNLGISGHVYEHLVRAQLYPRIMTSDLYSGNPFGGWRHVRAVTSNYTVKESDNGVIFTNRGASGAVNFTLPVAAKNGLRYGFYVVADQTVTVTSGTPDTLVVFNDSAADSVAFATTGARIGGFFEVIGDGTGWLVITHPGQTPAGGQQVTITT